MRRFRPSRTAEYMAFFRALESVRPAQDRLFHDPFAPQFVRPSLRCAIWLAKSSLFAGLVNRSTDLRLPGARTSAIARTRLIDDALAEALKTGISQVVILGAGFDCRAYRLPQGNSTVTFEVDHPATLASKLAALGQARREVPDRVRYVEIDFLRQTLVEVLERPNFESVRPAVFVWEGVTHYLTPEAVDSVLHFVARCAPGTRLIFTYVHSGLLDFSVSFKAAERLLRRFSQLGEPWTFGLFPERVADFLRERGLFLERDLSAEEYRLLYFGAAARRMQGYEFYHVAVASVPQ